MTFLIIFLTLGVIGANLADNMGAYKSAEKMKVKTDAHITTPVERVPTEAEVRKNYFHVRVKEGGSQTVRVVK